MNIKVCGITQVKQLQQLDALGIDFAGLIFFDGSPRCVKNKIVANDIADADFDLKKVGVFENADYESIMPIVDKYKLDCVQLHGNESPKLCKALSKELEVIKTFHFQENESVEMEKKIQLYDDVCDYFLFDAFNKDGLSAEFENTFDWSLLNCFEFEKPFFISGGVCFADINKINTIQHPDLFAIDLNSRFETSIGVKDLASVIQFKKNLKR